MKKVKQVVVLAAGQSSRFYPYGQSGHKSTITILGQPIICWTLAACRRAGFTKVVLVINAKDKSLINLIDDYTDQFEQVDIVFQAKAKGQA
ncbi:MAG: NTP transferase domain-containing protein, partial [Candidatus Pacebacteria bacterium]|nr:NTP transferase domain-containing protein [Candidatus Paceibacterota bacterium]